MPNVATVLREEIQRLARKEVKAAIGPLQKKGADQRRYIADLRRQVAALEREVARLVKHAGRQPRKAASAAPESEIRFSPKWVAADRRRLDLSARDYAALVGVSMLTIYNWEKGKSKPRAPQLAAWAEIRGIGKREALRRLEALEA